MSILELSLVDHRPAGQIAKKSLSEDGCMQDGPTEMAGISQSASQWADLNGQAWGMEKFVKDVGTLRVKARAPKSVMAMVEEPPEGCDVRLSHDGATYGIWKKMGGARGEPTVVLTAKRQCCLALVTLASIARKGKAAYDCELVTLPRQLMKEGRRGSLKISSADGGSPARTGKINEEQRVLCNAEASQDSEMVDVELRFNVHLARSRFEGRSDYDADVLSLLYHCCPSLCSEPSVLAVEEASFVRRGESSQISGGILSSEQPQRREGTIISRLGGLPGTDGRGWGRAEALVEAKSLRNSLWRLFQWADAGRDACYIDGCSIHP